MSAASALVDHPFTVRDFHKVHLESEKHSKVIEEVLGDGSHGYEGFDAFVVARWMARWIDEMGLEPAKPGQELDLATIEKDSCLRQQTVFQLLVEEIMPVLGVNVPEKRLKNTTGFQAEYLKFAAGIQKYLD